VPPGRFAEDLLARSPGAGHENDFVFSVKTRTGVCRDDRDSNQHFLRPAAKKLEIYQKGFGFHAFRHEAITEHGKTMGTLQTQRVAGHSKTDMSQHYTLADFEAQEWAVLALQDRVRIKPDQDKFSTGLPAEAPRAAFNFRDFKG